MATSLRPVALRTSGMAILQGEPAAGRGGAAFGGRSACERRCRPRCRLLHNPVHLHSEAQRARGPRAAAAPMLAQQERQRAPALQEGSGR